MSENYPLSLEAFSRKIQEEARIQREAVEQAERERLAQVKRDKIEKWGVLEYASQRMPEPYYHCQSEHCGFEEGFPADELYWVEGEMKYKCRYCETLPLEPMLTLAEVQQELKKGKNE